MRKLILIAALIAISSLGSARAAAPPSGATSRLGVGDEVRVRVFEWRSSVGDVHEWAALNADYRVGSDGTVSLPLVGAVKAAGLTVDQLADTISNQLQSSVGLQLKPQASVEIKTYRPFYILGDVNKPGEYPYRPGLTVLEAISIAEGRYRVNDPALLLTTTGDLRVYRIQYNQLLARRARLQAQLSDANSISFPPELLRAQNDPDVAQTIRRETGLFNAQRDAFHAQVDALNQLRSLLSSEVVSLQGKMKNMDEELGLMKQELNNTTALVQRGLAIAPREYSLRETELDTESRRLDLDTAELRAKEDIEKADQSLIELRNKTRSQIETDLSDAEQKLPELAARIATSSTIVDREATAPTASATGEEAMARALILRPNDGKTQTIEADETAAVEPGDTIKILRAQPDTSPASIGSVSAEDPPAQPPAARSQAAPSQYALTEPAEPQPRSVEPQPQPQPTEPQPRQAQPQKLLPGGRLQPAAR
jgi:polysaccharide biosynthesis/export protein ExoF